VIWKDSQGVVVPVYLGDGGGTMVICDANGNFSRASYTTDANVIIGPYSTLDHVDYVTTDCTGTAYVPAGAPVPRWTLQIGSDPNYYVLKDNTPNRQSITVGSSSPGLPGTYQGACTQPGGSDAVVSAAYLTLVPTPTVPGTPPYHPEFVQ
jgi:hypothetical protein